MKIELAINDLFGDCGDWMGKINNLEVRLCHLILKRLFPSLDKEKPATLSLTIYPCKGAIKIKLFSKLGIAWRWQAKDTACFNMEKHVHSNVFLMSDEEITKELVRWRQRFQPSLIDLTELECWVRMIQ